MLSGQYTWEVTSASGCTETESFTITLGGSVISGCTNPIASNYNPMATVDEGSCAILGCTDDLASNYDPAATIDNGSCEYPGCTDPNASNYSSYFNIDDGSCEYPGCTDPAAINYDPNANVDDGSCIHADPCQLVIASLDGVINTTPDSGIGDGSAQIIFNNPAGIILSPGATIQFWWYTGTVANHVLDATLLTSSSGISTGTSLNLPSTQFSVNNLTAGNYHVSVDTGDGCYRWFDFVIPGIDPEHHIFRICGQPDNLILADNQSTNIITGITFNPTQPITNQKEGSQYNFDWITTNVNGGVPLNVGDVLEMDYTNSSAAINNWTSSVVGLTTSGTICLEYFGICPSVPNCQPGTWGNIGAMNIISSQIQGWSVHGNCSSCTV